MRRLFRQTGRSGADLRRRIAGITRGGADGLDIAGHLAGAARRVFDIADNRARGCFAGNFEMIWRNRVSGAIPSISGVGLLIAAGLGFAGLTL